MEEHNMKLDNILVPIDFSDHSLAALALARELAEKFDATLHLLHVYPLPVAVPSPYGPTVPPDFSAQVESAVRNHLDEWQQKHLASGQTASTHVKAGNASLTIVDIASNVDADLIVMGTRGLTGMKHVLLGSTTERTVRLAPCPVLTTKAEAHAETS
jgi:nucleotide-binding universal stress UspA family protein